MSDLELAEVSFVISAVIFICTIVICYDTTSVEFEKNKDTINRVINFSVVGMIVSVIMIMTLK